MAIIEGTRALKTWKGTYSFAVDGGAVGTITLRSDDGPIPSGSIVVDGTLEVTTALTTGTTTTAALQVEAANDTVNAATVAGAPWSSTGRKSVIPLSGATSLKTTAGRSPALVIASADLTAGVFNLILAYR